MKRTTAVAAAAAAAASILIGCGGSQPGQTGSLADRGTGLILTGRDQYRSYPTAPRRYGAGPGGSTPPEFILPGLPPISDQGTQWSCVAFAVAYARTYEEHTRFGWALPYTLDHRLSPAFIYNQAWERLGNATCLTAGMDIGRAMNLVVQAGVSTLKSFDYNPTRCDLLPGAPALNEASTFQALGWRTVPVDPVDMRDYLLLKAPIVIGIDIAAGFRDWTGTGTYHGLQGAMAKEHHAMVVVGYNDSKRSFRVANSWGPTWGDNGYMWADYALFQPDSKEVSEAYITFAKPSQSDLAASSALFALANYAMVASGSVSAQTATAATPGIEFPKRYTLTVNAEEGRILQNPKVECVAGPCGQNGRIEAVSISEDRRHGTATLAAWGAASTWKLTIDQSQSTLISTALQRAAPGDVIQVGARPDQSFALFGLQKPSQLVEPTTRPTDWLKLFQSATVPSKKERVPGDMAATERLTFIVPKGVS